MTGKFVFTVSNSRFRWCILGTTGTNMMASITYLLKTKTKNLSTVWYLVYKYIFASHSNSSRPIYQKCSFVQKNGLKYIDIRIWKISNACFTNVLKWGEYLESWKSFWRRKASKMMESNRLQICVLRRRSITRIYYFPKMQPYENILWILQLDGHSLRALRICQTSIKPAYTLS